MTNLHCLGTVGYMGGIPAVMEPFCHSWGRMCAFTERALCQPDEFINYDRSLLSLHDYARNDLAMRMMGDWLIMLDCDLRFEPDIAARLVSIATKYNVDVLTGMYTYKSHPHLPIVYMYDEDKKIHSPIAKWDKSNEIFRVDSSGGGLLFVRRKVFDRIRQELKRNPFDRIGCVGEDHSFAYAIRALGIKMYCAWKVQAEHLGYIGFNPNDSYDEKFGCDVDPSRLKEFKGVEAFRA